MLFYLGNYIVMLLYELLQVEEGLYSEIAILGDKNIYNALKKYENEFLEFKFFEYFKDYPKKKRIFRRVVNSLDNVDYNKIYESIHHQGFLITTPNIYTPELIEKLYDINFVAINEVDKYIVAKRMHGWGN
jgi:hypothetical protein